MKITGFMFLGTAITGEWERPVPVRSLDEFKNLFGTKSPEGSITFEYVAGILSAGLPVLFRRIACVGQSSGKPDLEQRAKQATLSVSHFSADESDDVVDFIIMERYGGTFGNDINITIRNTGVAYWIDVYNKNTLLEKQKLITYKNENQLEINEKLIYALSHLNLERIKVDVLITDPSKFNLEPFSNSYLSGGTDFDESKVVFEIPESYDYIKDKILYSPKFLTSGGYTDGGYTDEEEAEEYPIATKMLNLTLLRQDCRALIDLPIGTLPEEQQALASQFSYQQLSDTQAIPSGSICAPWQYMQVGTSQLWVPPSFVYLTVVGNALSKGDKVYTPKAGITSGKISNILKSEFPIGSDICEAWQAEGSVNINPIMKLQSGDYVIAGNSTLLRTDTDELNAFSESSADLAIIEIRRFVYNLATELQYQYNSTTAFENFSLDTAKFLEGMISTGAVSDYEIANVSTDDDPRTLKIKLDVYLLPTIKSIEIYLNVSYGSIEMSAGGEA